jgi:MFS family permease
LTALSQGVFSLAALRSVATGGGESFYAPPAYALLAHFHKKTRALAMSIHQAALYIGIMTSGYFGGLIAKNWGWRSVFFVYGGAGILVGLLFILLLKDERDFAQSGEAEPAAAKPKWENPLHSLSIIFRKPTALLLTIGFTAIVYVNNAYITFAPGFLEGKFSLSKELAGTYAMLFHHLAALVGVLIGGPLSDRLSRQVMGGRLRIQTVTMFLGSAAILYMSWGATLGAACAGMILFGLFRGLYESNTHASLFDVIEPKYRSSAVGAMVMSAFLIGATAPWLMGILGDRGWSLSAVFAVYSLAYVVGGFAVGIALLFFFRKDRIVEEMA